MEKYGFVYIWYDRKHKRFYIGSHWGTEEDGYICSSSWMTRAYNRRPEDFKRRILGRTNERKQLNEAEHRWLQMINEEELGTRYYNLKNHRFGHWSLDDNSVCVIEKMANSLRKRAAAMTEEERKLEYGGKWRGKPSPFKGKTHTEETKKLIREKRKLQICSTETKAKMSETRKGRPWSLKRQMAQEARKQ